MPNLIYPPSQNGLQKQLDADLNSGVTASMTLTNTTGVQNKPGVVVINRIDTNGNELASSSREYISFTGTSGATLTGLTRGLGGTSDQDHSTGAVVEFIWDVVGHQAINDVITAEHGVDGTHGDITATSMASSGAVSGTTGTFTGTVEADELTIQSANIRNGWFAADETWTYSAWDDTNGVSTATITVPSDATAKYQAGMRVKFTQPTDGVKYGIITKVEATALTVFVNTDYDFDNEAITAPFYSPMDIPFGFVKDPLKYRVNVAFSGVSQATPTQNTWYNINSNSIDVPVGSWKVSYQTPLYVDNSSGSANINAEITLSTANNSESDETWSSQIAIGATAEKVATVGIYKENVLTLTTKDTYYLNARTTLTSMTNINVGYQTGGQLRAECAYL